MCGTFSISRKGSVMIIYEFGDPKADTVLIQPVDEYDLAGIENEIALISGCDLRGLFK